MRRNPKGAVSVRVGDLLETNFDLWWTVAQVVDEYESRWGRVAWGTVQQALYRMRGRDEVESRQQTIGLRRNEPRTAFRWKP